MATKIAKPPTSEEIVPAGFTIRYWQKEEGQRRRYKLNEDTVPSQSTLTDQLAKPALLASAHKHWSEGTDPRTAWEESAIQGTVTHDRVVNALKDGTPPPELDAWTQGAFEFWTEVGPKLLDAERMVGSLRHGFAGRFDFLCEFPNGIDLPRCKADPGTIGRLDLKTKSEWRRDKSGVPWPPYDEHYAQLELYELAAQESGYQSSDFRAILNVGPEGEWELYWSPATVNDALVLINLYHARQDLKARIKESLS